MALLFDDEKTINYCACNLKTLILEELGHSSWTIMAERLVGVILLHMGGGSFWFENCYDTFVMDTICRSTRPINPEFFHKW